MDKISEFVKERTDDDLFSLTNEIDKEIKCRLISLLKENNCTSVIFSIDEGVYASVINIYGANKFKNVVSTDVDIISVGYENVHDGESVYSDCLYVVTNEGIKFDDEEISEWCLWDLYKSTKDKLLKK